MAFDKEAASRRDTSPCTETSRCSRKLRWTLSEFINAGGVHDKTYSLTKEIIKNVPTAVQRMSIL